MLQLLGAAPVAAGFTWTDAEAAQAAKSAQAARPAAPAAGYQPKFFTAHEWATVHLLVDMIIPKDDRSGGATDAGVPEFMDFMMDDTPNRQTAMRGGLAWIDRQCEDRYEKRFVDCAPEQRRKRSRSSATASPSSTAFAISPRRASGRARWVSRT
jgi:hypothetical protein